MLVNALLTLKQPYCKELPESKVIYSRIEEGALSYGNDGLNATPTHNPSGDYILNTLV